MHKKLFTLLNIIASLFESQVFAVYPHFRVEKALCMTGNWFLGYNSKTKFYYQAIDVHPTGDYFVVGGSVGAQGTLYGVQPQYQEGAQHQRMTATNSNGAVLLLYPKFGSEPDRVFFIPNKVSLTASDSTEYNVSIRGVLAIKMAQSSTIKFSGIFSNEEGQLIYFKYSGSGVKALEIFSMTSIVGSPASSPDFSCWQYSRELFSFHESTGVDYAAYFSCTDPPQYFITVFDQSTVKDNFYFRMIESDIADTEQRWYLSAVAALEQNTLSWIGHGRVEKTSYLFLETVKQQLDGTFNHQSLLLVDIAKLGQFSKASPNSLIRLNASDWSIVSKMDSTCILVIQGTSLTNPTISIASFYNTSDSKNLSVAQAFAFNGQVWLLLKIDSLQTILVDPTSSLSRPIKFLNVDSTFSSKLTTMKLSISGFMIDSNQKIWALGAKNSVGFVIQQPLDDPTSACLKLSVQESATKTLLSTQVEQIEQIQSKDAVLLHASTPQTVIETYFSNSDLPPVLGLENQVNNPCKIDAKVSFDTRSLWIYVDNTIGKSQYIPYDFFSFSPSKCPNQSAPDSSPSFDGSTMGPKISYSSAVLDKGGQNALSFLKVYKSNQIQIEIDQLEKANPITGDTITLKYDQFLLNDDGLYDSKGSTTVKLSVQQDFTICSNFLKVPLKGTFDREILMGNTEEISLSGITNGDCVYELTVALLSTTPQVTPPPTLELQQPKFLVTKIGKGGADYDEVSLSQPGILIVKSQSTQEIGFKAAIRITAISRLNPVDTKNGISDFTLTFTCLPTFSMNPGPILIEYVVTQPQISQEYLLSKKRPCQVEETRFEMSIPSDSPLTFTANAAADGASILSLMSNDLSLSNTSIVLELTEIYIGDETKTKMTQIKVSFIDPCTLETLGAVTELGFEQIEQTLQIWWEPFSTKFPDWCIVDVTQIQIDSVIFTMSTQSDDPFAYIDFKSRSINLNVEAVTKGVEKISIQISEAIVLRFENTRGNAIQSQNFDLTLTRKKEEPPEDPDTGGGGGTDAGGGGTTDPGGGGTTDPDGGGGTDTGGGGTTDPDGGDEGSDTETGGGGDQSQPKQPENAVQDKKPKEPEKPAEGGTKFVPTYKNETETTVKPVIVEDKFPSKTPDQEDENDSKPNNEGKESPNNEGKESENSFPVFIWIVPAQKPHRAPQPGLPLPPVLPLQILKASMTDIGLLTLTFSKPLIVPVHLQDLQTRIRDTNFKDGADQLFSLTVLSDQFDANAIQTSIEKFSITRFQDTEVDLQIEFKFPEKISQSMSNLEDLQIEFLKPTVFTDNLDGEQLTQKLIIAKIPPQLSQALNAKVQAFNEAIDDPITKLSQSTLAVNLVLAYGLKYLWSMANVLQFMIFMGNWKINLDPFAMTMLQQLKKLALFEFIDTEPIKKKIKDLIQRLTYPQQVQYSRLRSLQEESPKPEQDASQEASDSSASRFGSTDLLGNSGIMILVAILLGILVFFLLVFRLVLKRCPSVQVRITKIVNQIFFNAIIRYLLQSTLKMQIAAATVIALATDGSVTSSIVILTVFNVVPFIFAILLLCKKGKLEEPKNQERIGSLYLNLNPKDSWTLLQPSVFMLRRSLFVLISFTLLEYPGLQVQAFVIITISNIVYSSLAVTFVDQYTKRIEVANEVLFLISCYHFMLFADSSSIEADQRAQIGVSMLCTIGALVFFNFTVIVRANVLKISRALFIRRLKQRRDSVLQERNLAMSALKSSMQLNETVNFAQKAIKAQIQAALHQEIARVQSQAQSELKTLVKYPVKTEAERLLQENVKRQVQRALAVVMQAPVTDPYELRTDRLEIIPDQSVSKRDITISIDTFGEGISKKSSFSKQQSEVFSGIYCSELDRTNPYKSKNSRLTQGQTTIDRIQRQGSAPSSPQDSSFSSLETDPPAEINRSYVPKKKSTFANKKIQKIVQSSIVVEPTRLSEEESRRLALQLVYTVTLMKERSFQTKSISAFEKGVKIELNVDERV